MAIIGSLLLPFSIDIAHLRGCFR